MDQKHAMLYPPLDPCNDILTRNERISASAAIGLPTEAPPSYDAAMLAGPSRSSTSTPVDSKPVVASTNAKSDSSNPITHTPVTASVVGDRNGTDASSSSTPPPKLGPNPCAVMCPTCSSCQTTRMSHTPNNRTHLSALVLCLVGWCCCACCVPYCMNSCRTGNHYCAKCNTFLGSFNPRRRI